MMIQALPIVLIPGLLGSPRLYGEQIPEPWRAGPVMIADNTRDDSMAAIARRILAAAPPRFAHAGLSMGGYAAEIASSIAGAQHVVVPDCGHMSTLEQPAMVTQTLVDWLQR